MATEPAKGGTQSVLDMMTAAVVGRKDPPKPNLTLVGSESHAEPATPAAAVNGAVFPFDNMTEVAAQVVANVRRQLAAMLVELAHLEEGLAGIEAQYGLTGGEGAPRPTPTAARAAEQKAIEAKADASFKASGQVSLADQVKTGHRKAAAVAAVAAEDESFSDAFKRKQAEAQAAVFAKPVAAPVATPPTSGWTCPTHKKSIVKTSRKGRTYLGCPECGEFE